MLVFLRPEEHRPLEFPPETRKLQSRYAGVNKQNQKDAGERPDDDVSVLRKNHHFCAAL
jgi:hypothetical protein